MVRLSTSLLIHVTLSTSFVHAQDPNDPTDLTFIKKGAAVGDSYAAGIGAGNRLDYSCSRYDGSYSNLVALQVVDDAQTDSLDFTYLACSGAVVSGVNDQVNKLSGGQEFIIMSAGGNDADLSGILNSCVYSFRTDFFHGNCDNKLAESLATIQSSSFASAVDGLIANAKTKLASGGDIYYVGYASFWDLTDRTCDSVSWHLWVSLFTHEFLTLERRTKMNELVDAMNRVLKQAVARAGSQVHFIDYDFYVGISNGRYCQPGSDESSGRGANRPDLFFYEMKTIDDDPWRRHENDWRVTDLKRRGNSFNDDGDIQPENRTLNAVFGALIEQALLEAGGPVEIQEDQSNDDLDVEVKQEETMIKRSVERLRRPRLSASRSFRRLSLSGYNATQNTTMSSDDRSTSQLLPVSSSSSQFSTFTSSLRTTSSALSSSPSRHVPPGAPIIGTHIGNITQGNGTHGRLVSNGTHIVVNGTTLVPLSDVTKFFVSDSTTRVFHPTQNGHALIANLILYQMAAVNAKKLGVTDFPAELVTQSGQQVPQIPGAFCQTVSSDSWTSRDPMFNAVKAFCADPRNLRGDQPGQRISGLFNANSFDYLKIEIDFNEPGSIGQHTCEAWLDAVTDSCDVANADNSKHGGAITYNGAVNATMNIFPLVVRQIFDQGKVTDKTCNDNSNSFYLDANQLDNNIQNYCQRSAAQPGGIANAGSSFSMTFNDGTPSKVKLTTTWPLGERNFQLFREECVYYMNLLSADCNVPDSTNPLNWKHGGQVFDNNNVQYKIEPLANRPPPPSSPQGVCAVGSTGLGYLWNVFGNGWLDDDYGIKLLRAVQGCGAVTGWKFDYRGSPDTDGTEWTASGTLPYFISDHCLGKAISQAGGFSSNC